MNTMQLSNACEPPSKLSAFSRGPVSTNTTHNPNKAWRLIEQRSVKSLVQTTDCTDISQPVLGKKKLSRNYINLSCYRCRSKCYLLQSYISVMFTYTKITPCRPSLLPSVCFRRTLSSASAHHQNHDTVSRSSL
jgi:hypothetical protein